MSIATYCAPQGERFPSIGYCLMGPAQRKCVVSESTYFRSGGIVMQRSIIGATLVSFLMIATVTGCATQSKALVSGNTAASASGNAAAQTKTSASASSQSGSQAQTGTGSTAGSGGSATTGAQGSVQAQTSVTAKGSSPNISTTQKTKAQTTVNQMAKIVNQLH